MELEKSDAVECIEEKLTNQITILTREMRELKELLNHTMNERTLAIGHAHKLVVRKTF
jgi:hydroxymethylpyrimidine/phosphomethylpyrimidine kinase